jgi:uncharacterized damage-inducible protein DinB
MVDANVTDGNAAVTARLTKLVESLSDADLNADLGGGWTTGVALAHLAFWDRRIAYVLTRWSEGGTPHEELDDDVVNNALEQLLQSIDPRIASRLAVESATRADAAIASVPNAIADQLIREGHIYLLSRHNHRTEHIEQIAAVIGTRT